MNSKIVAALLALVALPVAAQTTPARVGEGPVQAQAGQAKAKADGVVTQKERAKLAKAQNKESKKIHKQKHDPQKKAPAAG